MKFINEEGEIVNDFSGFNRRAEDFLKQKEINFKHVIGTTIVQDGKFVFINRLLLDKLGCKNDQDIIGKVFLSFVHKDSLHKFLILLEHSDQDNSRAPMKGKLVRMNGSTIFAEFETFPILFKGHPSIYLRITEIYSENEYNDMYNIGQKKSLKNWFYEIRRKMGS